MGVLGSLELIHHGKVIMMEHDGLLGKMVTNFLTEMGVQI